MNDIKQIQVINKALQKEREKYLFELAKTNVSIEKKINLIKKMSLYLKEYAQDDNLTISKSSPTLSMNLNSFSKQIEKVILQTEVEIEKLKKSSEAIMHLIQKIDQKIKLMDMFLNRVEQANLLKADKVEQLAIDDIASTKHLRGNHE